MKFTLDPVRKFVRLKYFGSICMFFASLAALIMANSSLNSLYNWLLDLEFTVGFSEFKLTKSLLHWINDGLMVFFFFVIGLEIKREFFFGELKSKSKAILPVFAALGGMIVPITIFLAFNHGKETIEGWGIPMATDIAFSLGAIRILGKRIPFGLVVFLTTFAIVDDLGAVLIIAFFYNSIINWFYILLALLLLLVLTFFSFKNYYYKFIYIPISLIIWILFLKSGIHPTIAGVLIAFTIPSYSKKNFRKVLKKGKKALNELSQLTDEKEVVIGDHKIALYILDHISSEIQSPLQHLQNKFHGFVSFIVLPLFAFANSGIVLMGNGINITGLSLTIAFSLVFGKVIGITLFTYLLVKLQIALLPLYVNFKQIVGLGFLGGIGFTMSIFISNLSYQSDAMLNESKTGILLGSTFALIFGLSFIRYSLIKRRKGGLQDTR